MGMTLGEWGMARGWVCNGKIVVEGERFSDVSLGTVRTLLLLSTGKGYTRSVRM